MAVVHDGLTAPQLPGDMNPNDIDTFYISWENDLKGSSIALSTWTIPTGFTEVSAVTDVTVTEDGTSYLNSNGITVSTTKTTGRHSLSNNVTFADGRELTRSFIVEVDPKL